MLVHGGDRYRMSTLHACISAATGDCDSRVCHVLQISVVNFLQYNVAGGGESALYGVEPASFYIFNGILNFGAAFPASVAFILVPILAASKLTSARTSARECTAMAPLYVMLPALLALPHKEERFLAVLYPQVGPNIKRVA